MAAKSPTDKPPRKALHASDDASAEAREQATEYDGIYASTRLDLDGGDFIMIPVHPDYGLLDDDRMQAYEELLYEADTEYLRGPDIVIPEQHVKDANGDDTGMVVPGETVRGPLLRPFRKLVDGVVQQVKPPHTVRMVQAALGEAEYKRLRDGGRSAGDVLKIWAEQTERINERRKADSKSEGSAVGVAAVPATTS